MQLGLNVQFKASLIIRTLIALFKWGEVLVPWVAVNASLCCLGCFMYLGRAGSVSVSLWAALRAGCRSARGEWWRGLEQCLWLGWLQSVCSKLKSTPVLYALVTDLPIKHLFWEVPVWLLTSFSQPPHLTRQNTRYSMCWAENMVFIIQEIKVLIIIIHLIYNALLQVVKGALQLRHNRVELCKVLIGDPFFAPGRTF